MASKNNITGDEIKSKALSPQGRKNWDRIFAKKTANEWLAEYYPNIVIYDPDGWREGDGITMDTPITLADFERRLNMSTILGQTIK